MPATISPACSHPLSGVIQRFCVREAVPLELPGSGCAQDGWAVGKITESFDESKVKRDREGQFAKQEGRNGGEPAKSDGQTRREHPDIASPRTPKIETPEFKNWFGDWTDPLAFTSKRDPSKPPVSMAVDDDGRPKVFYHGTLGDFDEFQVGREGTNSGTFGSWKTQRHAVFLSPTPELANAFTSQGGETVGGNVKPVFLSVKAPLDLRSGFSQADLDEFAQAGMNPRWLMNNAGWELFDDEDGKLFVETAKKLGYDGVIFTDDNPETGDSEEAWAVFRPEQIKSAISNRGTYDPENPKIGESFASEAWIEYDGPRGGEGWENTETGKVAYVKEQPGQKREGKTTEPSVHKVPPKTAPDARDVLTPQQFGEYLKQNADKWFLDQDAIDNEVARYARRGVKDKLEQMEAADYPLKLDSSPVDLRMVGSRETERIRLTPSADDLRKLWLGKIDLDPNDTIFVRHQTSPQWQREFMEVGIDTRTAPPDSRLGRLTATDKGFVQSRIDEPGLFVEPNTVSDVGGPYGVILQVKAGQIKPSPESTGLGYKTGLDGLYGAKDAILAGEVIPPENVVGIYDYDHAAGKPVWIPNPRNPNSGKLRVGVNGGLEMVEDAGPPGPVEKTDTPEFKAWFGNSQVVDQQGKPLVLYHGTNRSFDAFDPQRQRTARNSQFQGDGFFFTEDPEVAERYADAAVNQTFDRATILREMRELHPGVLADLLENQIDHGYEKGWELTLAKYGLEDKPIQDWPAELQEHGNDINDLADFVEGSRSNEREEDVSDVFAAMSGGGPQGLPEYSLDLATKLGLSAPAPAIMPVYLRAEKILHTDDPEEAKTARQRGYDAVRYTGPGRVGDAAEWIVFEPDQIKSATGNRGTWERGNPKITETRWRGRVTEPLVFEREFREDDVLQAARRYRVHESVILQSDPTAQPEVANEPLSPHPLHRIIGELRPCDLPARYAEEPFKSEAQRRWMWANDPEMARRWEDETPDGKDLPERVSGESWLDTWKRGPLASEAWSQHEGPRGGTYYLRDGDQESKTYRRPGELEPRPAGLLDKADTTAKQDSLADAIAAVAAWRVSDRARDLYDEPDYQQAHEMRDLRNAYPTLRRAQDAITGLVLLDRPAELEAWAAGKSHPQTTEGLNTLAALAPRFYPEPLTLYRAKSHWKGEALGLWTDSIDEADRLGGVLETREVRPDEIVAGPKMSADLNRHRMFLVRGDGQDHTSHFPLTEPLQKFADGLGKPAYVNLDRYVNYPAEPILDAIHDQLGREWSDDDYARLGGALEGAKVFLTGDQDTLEISIESPEYFCGRAVGVVDGQLVMENQQFEVYRDHQGRGLGTKVFAQQIAACERMGVTKIGCEAARSFEMNGYYTWPRLGYDAELTADEWAGRASKKKYQSLTGESDEAIRRAVLEGIAKLGLPLDRSFRLQDLMRSPDGRALWKRYGVTLRCEFDPRPGSVSRRVFDAYVKEKFPDLLAAESWARLWEGDGDEPLELEIPDRRVNEFDVGPDEDEEVFARIWDRIAAEEAGGRRRLSEAAPLGRVQVVENAFDPHYILARELGIIQEDWTQHRGPRGGTYWLQDGDPASKTYRKPGANAKRTDVSVDLPDTRAGVSSAGSVASDPQRALFDKAGEPAPAPAHALAKSQAELESRYARVADLYRQDAGVSEGYTIGEHTGMVLDMWDRQTNPDELAALSERLGVDVPRVMQTALMLHDIGKPLAIEEGEKWRQHEFTLPIMADVMAQDGFGPQEIQLAQAVVGHDIFGDVLRGRQDPSDGAAKLIAKAQEAGVDPVAFSELASLYFTADAASYPYLYNKVFREGEGGRLEFKSPAYRELMDEVAAQSRPAEPEPKELPRGSEAVKQHVATWTPEEKERDWRENGTRGGSFKAFFGDWEHDLAHCSKVLDQETGEPKETGQISGEGSKVTDDDGLPKAVYHGTAFKGFQAFDKAKLDPTALYGPGFYFTEDPLVAGGTFEKRTDWQPFDSREEAKEVTSKAPGMLRYHEPYQDQATGKWMAPTGYSEHLEKAGYTQKGIPPIQDPVQRAAIRDALMAELENRGKGYLTIDEVERVKRDIGNFMDDRPVGSSQAGPNPVAGDLNWLGELIGSQPYNLNVWDAALQAGLDIKGEIKLCYLNIRNPFRVDREYTPEEARRIVGEVLPDGFGLAKTHVLIDDKAKGTAVGTVRGDELYDMLTDVHSKAEINQRLARAGFDGITHIGGNRQGGGHLHRVWIAFEPTQIKANDNRGTFDTSSANMYESWLARYGTRVALEEWTRHEGPRGGVYWLKDGQGKPRYQKEQPGEAESGQKRAKPGGEIGPNREFYRGGTFIATTELPKMAQASLERAASKGKVQYEPYKWVVPEPGRLSIIGSASLSPIAGAILRNEPDSVNDDALAYLRISRELVQDMAQRYAAGERWIEAADYPELMNFNDVARMVKAGMPIPDGAPFTRADIASRLGITEADLPVVEATAATDGFSKLKATGLEPERRGDRTVVKAEIPMPPQVQTLAAALKLDDNVKLYAVGGAVRDFLMNRLHEPGRPYRPKDVDLTTNLSEAEILGRLSSPEAAARGIKVKAKESVDTFGVVFANVNGVDFEVAPFRQDIGTADGRRPERVERGTMEQDAARRDLTMNNLYYDFGKGEILDLNPEGQGLRDIAERVTRPVGDPAQRFEEDRLRVLRLVRFFSRFNEGEIRDFLDPQTRAAVEKYRDLPGVTPERIETEFAAGLQKARSPAAYLENYRQLGLLDRSFQGLRINTEDLSRVGQTRDRPTVLAWLLRDEPQVRDGLNRLKYSNDVANRVQFLVDAMNMSPEEAPRIVRTKEQIRLAPNAALAGGVPLSPEKIEALNRQRDEELREQILALAAIVPEREAAIRLRHLAVYQPPRISGAELAEAGFSGPEIGREQRRRVEQHYRDSLEAFRQSRLAAESWRRNQGKRLAVAGVGSNPAD